MKLNLDDLTQAHVDEATRVFGFNCEYAGPCIIGTLIPPERRRDFDGGDGTVTAATPDTSLLSLLDAGLFQFPNDVQADEACALQRAFDYGDPYEFERVLAKRGLKLNHDLIPVTPA